MWEDPGVYSTSPRCLALHSHHSDLAETGMLTAPGRFCFTYSILGPELAISALFSARTVGNLVFRKMATIPWTLASSHCRTALREEGVLMSKPHFASTASMRPFDAWYPDSRDGSRSGLRKTVCHLDRTFEKTQQCSSRRNHLISSRGVDASGAKVAAPSLSVVPLASTTWMSTSASQRSLRKAFPRPRPLYAPGTRPATSFTVIWARRQRPSPASSGRESPGTARGSSCTCWPG
mmetsp:Transcript_4999/g.12176  ORF Transcript_4999/g.12176 Transcript_4999/m.12176 type:complete len:235 (+) Transcript_4999:635-1339(+)